MLTLPPLPPVSVFNRKIDTGLPSFELPPLFPRDVTPSSAPAKKSAPPLKEVSDSAPRPANSPFLSRKELEQKRLRCRLEYAGHTELEAPSKGSTLKLKFKNSSGDPCLAAASSAAPWVEASLDSKDNEVTLVIEPNAGPTARESEISVLAGNATFSFTLTQANRVHGCLRASARKGAQPIPEGFEL